MQVANSFPDSVNSAAQFINGAAKGDVASGATSQAADATNSIASLVSKNRKSSDEDFDAVLAMLLNGGIPTLQAPVVPMPVKVSGSGSINLETNVAESGTSSALDTAAISGANANAVGDANIGSVAQLLFRGRDSARQQPTASLALAKVAASLSGNTATSEIVEGANANGVSLASTTSTTFTSAMETAAETLNGQGGVPSQVTEDLKGSPTQVLPIVGTAASVDAAAISVTSSVSSEPSALVTAEPLTKEIIQALERIGRPPESKVVANQIPQPNTAAAKVSTSVESQVSAGSFLALNSTSAVVLATATASTTAAALKATTTTSSEQSLKVNTDQQATQSSDLKAFVSGLEDSSSSPSAATFLGSSSSESVEVKTRTTPTIESSTLVSNSAASATDPTTTATEQLQRSMESAKHHALSDADSLASDRPESQASSNSDLTAATIQSVLTSSASPNSVPDLAASISADIRQPLTSQVSQAIMDHVERNGVRQSDSLSVRLDPPELGEMTIQLSKTHEGLAVRVTAREAVTMDMLFARGQEIESQLRGQNMNLKSLEFQRADMSNGGFSQGQGQPQHQNNSSRRSENLLNQIRGGTRGLSPVNTSVRSLTPDSSYGLSFRA